MKAKQIAVVTLIVLVCSTLSAIVAYRRALRQVPPGLTKVGVPAGQTSPRGTPGCVDIHDAGPRAGGPGCVSGRLLRVFASRGGNTFLDFCEDYRNCPFTSVIFASDKSKFGDLGMLTGRQVEIQGTITVYQGHAEIIVRDPQQIRAVP
jgi:hypothetical protein